MKRLSIFLLIVLPLVVGAAGCSPQQEFFAQLDKIRLYPQVIWTSPADGEPYVSPATTIRIQTTQLLDPSSVNTNTVLLSYPDSPGERIPYTVFYDEATQIISVIPEHNFVVPARVTCVLTDGLHDMHGNPLVHSVKGNTAATNVRYSLTFTTSSP